MNPDSSDSEQSGTHSGGPIGTDGHTLRVLNFSGGGFDTVMQLGVVHALLTSYGRAPDAVVGVSAGAIQAVALADVMHAGDVSTTPRGELSAEQYAAALNRRVARFRAFVDAAHRAPEALLDSVLPDAYQVDSFEPLAALQLPRLSEEERADRNRWIEKKSGLVELYNDLLSLDLPFGAIVRIARRVLGIKAAGALDNGFKRWGVRIMESLRIWLLLGSELRRVTPVVPIIARPLLGKQRRVRKVSAGSIIFRFPFIDSLLGRSKSFVYFFVLLNLWVLASWLLFLIPFIAAGAVSNPDNMLSNLLNLLYLLYILPILAPLVPYVFWLNRTGVAKVWVDISKGLLSFLYYLLKWTVVLVLIVAPITLLAVQIMPAFFKQATLYPESLPANLARLTGGQIDANAPELRVALNLFSAAAGLILVWLLSVPARAIAMYLMARRRYGVRFLSWYTKRLLRYYNLNESLADNYGLKRFLVQLLDPNYYGSADIDEIIGQSMSDSDRSVRRSGIRRKRLDEFRAREDRPRIAVAVAAADVGSGRLVVLDPATPIIDALLAATAVNPIYPPKRIDGKLYIDGTKVGNVPTKALIELLDTHGIADIKCAHIYAVDPLPVSAEELGRSESLGNEPYENLIDIAARALHLQRFRDASIEHRLTSLVTRAIRPTESIVRVPGESRDREFFRGYVAHIELDKAASLNRRILYAKKNERRKAIGETIADGCRASLQVMLAQTFLGMPGKDKTRIGDEHEYAKCADVVNAARARNIDVDFNLTAIQMPGAGDNGPGLGEICRHCALRHRRTDVDDPPAQALEFRLNPRKSAVTDWPLELRSVDEATTRVPAARIDPNADDDPPAIRRPMRSCLFSGGVFRGVFQMGVVNAMNLVRLQPDLYAGASVGSITAAMAARALRTEDDVERSRRILQLAAIYLGMDRIVLTDRFADFVRNWTIRASNTRFSLRQADEVFRKYDYRHNAVFERDLRQVVAGLERLFYVNPYELNRIVHAARNVESAQLRRLLRDRVQNWLDRMEVGEQVLGAEAIKLLIEKLVLPESCEDDGDSVPLDCMGEDCQLLATTTNLTIGKLAVIGGEESDRRITMVEGLLASSAFPGVFRPRRSWDLMPGSNDDHQYVDGGLIDNLPVDAVWRVLEKMARERKIYWQPQQGPHLMLAASLEVTQSPEEEVNLERLGSYWPALGARSNELKYNIKLDTFARVARNLQQIRQRQLDLYPDDKEQVPIPLNVEILAIKPRWLCSTFAFHPMLGFRKIEQVRSIAHGCAATLLAFGAASGRADAWSLAEDWIPAHADFDSALAARRERPSSDRASGKCWLVDKTCPFSANALRDTLNNQGPADPNAVKWLSKIHVECWKIATHRQRKADHNR